jgi:hypothetical protein
MPRGLKTKMKIGLKPKVEKGIAPMVSKMPTSRAMPFEKKLGGIPTIKKTSKKTPF